MTHDDGIEIEPARIRADRRAIARIPVVPEPLDLDFIEEMVMRGEAGTRMEDVDDGWDR
jgi:hypothetical protein